MSEKLSDLVRKRQEAIAAQKSAQLSAAINERTAQLRAQQDEEIRKSVIARERRQAALEFITLVSPRIHPVQFQQESDDDYAEYTRRVFAAKSPILCRELHGVAFNRASSRLRKQMLNQIPTRTGWLVLNYNQHVSGSIEDRHSTGYLEKHIVYVTTGAEVIEYSQHMRPPNPLENPDVFKRLLAEYVATGETVTSLSFEHN